MRTVLSTRRLAWLVPMLGLLACAKKEAAAKPAAAESTAAMTPPPPPAPVNVTLAAKNRSNITGTVVLTQKGDSTEVALTLNGRPGEKLMSHIHGGTCAKAPGAVVTPLGAVTVGKDKSGTSTTMVLASVLDSARAKYGSLAAWSHLGRRPVACGEIPAQ